MSSDTTPRRTVRRMARAVATVAMAGGLMMGAGALASAPAAAGPNVGTDSNVSVQSSFQGPFQFWDWCNNDRKSAQYLGYRTTPCFKDPDGWYYQIY